MTVLLSSVVSDFNGIVSQLQSDLASTSAWKDLFRSGVGETLIEYIAGGVAYNQFSIERAVQECFLETATSNQTIYSLARLLGVPIQRYVGAGTQVSLSNNTQNVISIPAYTQLVINNSLNFITPVPLSVPPAPNSISVTLYEGAPVNHNFTSDGSIFQRFLVGSNFTSSNDYIRVKVNGVEWSRILTGMYAANSTDQVFYASTTQSGQVEILFGNGINGVVPPNNAVVQIIEYVVSGDAINNSVSGLTVACSLNPAITGVTTTNIYGGQGVIDIDNLRYLTPRLYAANQRAVTRQDHQAIALTYPGIVDCLCVGEKELGPGNPAYFNVVGLVCITSTPWTDDQKKAFIAWMSNYTMATVFPQFISANVINSTVAGTVILDPSSYSDTVMSNVQQAILNLYKLGIGSIGKSIYLSDVYEVVMQVAGVRHFNMTAPSANQVPLYNQYYGVPTLSLTSSF